MAVRNTEIDMNYRLAKESDIEIISDIVKSAIVEMENNNIYPTKDDFLIDIKRVNDTTEVKNTRIC